MPRAALSFVALVTFVYVAIAAAKSPATERWQKDLGDFRQELARVVDAAAGPPPADAAKQQAAAQKAQRAVVIFLNKPVEWTVKCSAVYPKSGPLFPDFIGPRPGNKAGATTVRVSIGQNNRDLPAWKDVKKGDTVVFTAVVDRLDSPAIAVDTADKNVWHVVAHIGKIKVVSSQ